MGNFVKALREKSKIVQNGIAERKREKFNAMEQKFIEIANAAILDIKILCDKQASQGNNSAVIFTYENERIASHCKYGGIAAEYIKAVSLVANAIRNEGLSVEYTPAGGGHGRLVHVLAVW